MMTEETEIGLMVSDSDEKPNPEEYKVQMRTVHAVDGGHMRHNDFVSSNSNTGRVKLEQKRWTPKAKPQEGDNAFRNDDWMGSGKTQRKSWKVKEKSTSGVIPASSEHSTASAPPDSFVQTPTGESVRRWRPPPKDSAVLPPWMVAAASPSPTKSARSSVTAGGGGSRPPTTPARRATTMHTWKPSSPPPVNRPIAGASKSTDMTLEELQSGSNSSRVKDAIDIFNNSMSNSMSSLGANSFHGTNSSHSPTKPLRPIPTSVHSSADSADGGHSSAVENQDDTHRSDDVDDPQEEQPETEPTKAVTHIDGTISETTPEVPSKDDDSTDESESQPILVPEPEPHEDEITESVEEDEDDITEDVTTTASPTMPATPSESSTTGIGLVVEDDDDDDDSRPNPEEFKIQMRTVHQSEDAGYRHNDFVSSNTNTGRIKLQKKGWTPTKKPEAGDNAFRNDDWMGSGKTTKRSWKVKS